MIEVEFEDRFGFPVTVDTGEILSIIEALVERVEELEEGTKGQEAVEEGGFKKGGRVVVIDSYFHWDNGHRHDNSDQIPVGAHGIIEDFHEDGDAIVRTDSGTLSTVAVGGLVPESELQPANPFKPGDWVVVESSVAYDPIVGGLMEDCQGYPVGTVGTVVSKDEGWDPIGLGADNVPVRDYLGGFVLYTAPEGLLFYDDEPYEFKVGDLVAVESPVYYSFFTPDELSDAGDWQLGRTGRVRHEVDERGNVEVDGFLYAPEGLILLESA